MYNIWNKWDPLKVCMLGNNYAPEFFNGLPNKAGDPLKRICEETLEDLDGYKKILQDFGVEVIQPDMDRNERFLDNPSKYPRGPLQPRDYQLVIGNRCYSSTGDHPAIRSRLKNYAPLNVPEYKIPFISCENKYNILAGESWPSWENFCINRKNKEYFEDFVWRELLNFTSHSDSSAIVFMVGKKVIVGDTHDIELTLEDVQGLSQFKEFDVTVANSDGHADANYHPIKPGVILSLRDVQNYEITFPGWDVCYLPNQSWSKVKPFLDLKSKNQGKWWLAGEEHNDEFTQFVENWLQDWVGYVEETVFDVNVLMLDEHHCCVSNIHNEKVNKFFKKHKIEPVYVPWRHRYFWDGGLHCITLDLYREGTQQDYFNH